MVVSQMRDRVAAVGAMAVLWAFFFNARLFPISLASASYGTLTPLALYLVYGLSLVAACGLAVFLGAQPRAAAYRRSCALAGSVAGLVGALLVMFPYGDFDAATLMVGVGTGAMALFLVAQFWYWTALLRSREASVALVDAAVGLGVYCACAAPAALLHTESPAAFALLPLVSLGCTLLCPAPAAAGRSDDLGKPAAAGAPVATGEGFAGLSRGLVRRVLVPAVLYLYLVQAMNVSLDVVTLLPIAAFRPWVFVFAVMAVAALVLTLLDRSAPSVKRFARAFNIVSACLLTALFVTCCQTVGLLPVGNYAVVAAKIMLCFFIWMMLVLRPAAPAVSRGCAVLLSLYLLLVLWLPNLAQSAILAAHPAPQTPDQLSWLFLLLSGVALAVSVGSNVIISSLVTGAPAGADAAAAAEGAVAPALELSPQLPGAEAAATASSAAGSGEGAVAAPDPRHRAVALFQARYGLSDREAEITRLACEGKTAKRIARELFIAESTAYTHLKHVYRKAGVHSKQELVDMVEGLCL